MFKILYIHECDNIKTQLVVYRCNDDYDVLATTY